MKARHLRSSQLTYFWLGLAFQAGIINSEAFLLCGRFVSHVTGFATHFGIEAVRNSWLDALGMLSVPLYFLLGAMLSGLWVLDENPEYESNNGRSGRGSSHGYSKALALMAFLLIVSFLMARYWGQGNSLVTEDGVSLVGYALLAVLAFVCGMQNALFTRRWGPVIRTTHLTGTLTDLGVGLVRLRREQAGSFRRQDISRANWLRLWSVLAFLGGSWLGAVMFFYGESLSFLLPAILALHFFFLEHLRVFRS